MQRPRWCYVRGDKDGILGPFKVEFKDAVAAIALRKKLEYFDMIGAENVETVRGILTLLLEKFSYLTHSAHAARQLQSEEQFIHVDCDLCGGQSHDLLFEKEGFPHVRCRDCGMVFVNPRLAGHGEQQRSEGTGTMGEERLTPGQIRRLRRELTSMEPFRKHNRMLEIGAGRGWFLEQASKHGWQTCALEINESALAHLRSRGIDRIVVEPAESFQAEPGVMDVVRMWDVIEHLESPRKAVKRIRQALRPGGLVRLSTTNFASLSRWINGPEWVYLNGADHIFLFEPRTITRLLSEHGFSNIHVSTRSFNMRRKLYHPPMDLSPKFPLMRPFRKLIDETIRFTLYGHQMIVTAIKAGASSLPHGQVH